jgi:hypothetical protein
MVHRNTLGLSILIILCTTQVAGSCRKSTTPVTPGEAVVFDIDGTLSDDPFALLFVREGAVAAVEAWLDLGYEVILLTSRDESLELVTRAWLEEKGFPDLPLYMSEDLLLFDWQRVAHKRDTLLELEDEEDLDFVYAYGDSSTDFEAYAQAGIPETEVFALEECLTHECEPGDWAECLPDYVDHVMDYIWAQPPAL